MSRKQVYMIINPRAGQDMTQLADVIAIFSAAGWKVDNALVEYSGHAMKLAMKAAEDGYGLLIAHGGDGTVNEVMNGAMAVKRKKRPCSIGVLPGGTANQWAHEMGIPLDPIHAALALVNSEGRNIDIGSIEVQEIQRLSDSQEVEQQTRMPEKVKPARGIRNHFLLTAGFGVDALVISHTPKSLKERIGRSAFEIEAVKEWPQLHSFKTTIDAQDREQAARRMHWEGEALQLVLGNTRLYADTLEFTPDAVIDDGLLDVCVLTPKGPLTTIQQAASLLLRHKPSAATTAYLRGSSITITAPALVQFQLDGSAMELSDYIDSTAKNALQSSTAEQVLITYCIDVLPSALSFLVPRGYDGPLFSTHPAQEDQQQEQPQSVTNSDDKEQKLHRSPTQSPTQSATPPAQTQNMHQITVVGVAPLAEKKQTYVLAGHSHKQSTGDMKPAAIRVDEDTILHSQTNGQVPLSTLEALEADAIISVEGKESKRGVIKARRIFL